MFDQGQKRGFAGSVIPDNAKTKTRPQFKSNVGKQYIVFKSLGQVMDPEQFFSLTSCAGKINGHSGGLAVSGLDFGQFFAQFFCLVKPVFGLCCSGLGALAQPLVFPAHF